MSKTPSKRGRPAGMRPGKFELKQTLLEHPHALQVLEAAVSATLGDDHKNQTVVHQIQPALNT